jgi:predicted ATP-dependent Lon-type protease
MEQTSEKTLEQKMMEHFTGKVVRKDLTSRVKETRWYPRMCWNTCWDSIAP